MKYREVFPGLFGVAAALLLILAFSASTVAAQDDEPVDYGMISQGRTLYQDYCRSCHGTTGHGDGPVAEGLRVAPGDLTLIRERNGGEFPFAVVEKKIDGRVKVRAHGESDMPVWGDALLKTEETGSAEVAAKKITALVHFLRSIQAAPSP